ncbi:MAG: PD-(D/E)XK nuclease domain-containing protein, partial [Planctomycetaceae bacterium]|nr:PD-(D/E)XK nuclease domain-containing protein [Planctomycetaceae bacterium]
SGLADNLDKMIAHVPYDIHIPCEHYYHSLMLMWLGMLGFKVHAEEHNNFGRSDAVWEQSGFTVVAEMKYHAEKTVDMLLDEAMKQIHEKRYYNKYHGKVILLGVAFSGRQPGCRMEELKRE